MGPGEMPQGLLFYQLTDSIRQAFENKIIVIIPRHDLEKYFIFDDESNS